MRCLIKFEGYRFKLTISKKFAPVKRNFATRIRILIKYPCRDLQLFYCDSNDRLNKNLYKESDGGTTTGETTTQMPDPCQE